jgi:hypothetical protein
MKTSADYFLEIDHQSNVIELKETPKYNEDNEDNFPMMGQID